MKKVFSWKSETKIKNTIFYESTIDRIIYWGFKSLAGIFGIGNKFRTMVFRRMVDGLLQLDLISLDVYRCLWTTD